MYNEETKLILKGFHQSHEWKAIKTAMQDFINTTGITKQPFDQEYNPQVERDKILFLEGKKALLEDISSYVEGIMRVNN